MRASFSRMTIVALAATALAGCSFTFIDSEGRTNRAGLIWLVTDRTPAQSIAGEFLAVTTVGLAVASLPTHASAALGYNREALLMLHNDACVAGDIGWLLQR